MSCKRLQTSPSKFNSGPTRSPQAHKNAYILPSSRPGARKNAHILPPWSPGTRKMHTCCQEGTREGVYLNYMLAQTAREHGIPKAMRRLIEGRRKILEISKVLILSICFKKLNRSNKIILRHISNIFHKATPKPES